MNSPYSSADLLILTITGIIVFAVLVGYICYLIFRRKNYMDMEMAKTRRNILIARLKYSPLNWQTKEIVDDAKEEKPEMPRPKKRK